MFKKIIIAEDLGSISQGLLSITEKLEIKEIVQTEYCDEAYLKIRRAALEGSPFELLITDLSFKADHREQDLKDGKVLVRKLKEKIPDLKIIVFSVEDKLQVVRTLINECKADAYVVKGRKGMEELHEAIIAVSDHKSYLSPKVESALSRKEDLDINEYDLEMLELLAKGYSQDDISKYFKSKNMVPNSLSSVEKRLNKLRIQFHATNAVQLVVIAKDMGLI
ncbi:response regulator [Flavobacteriaceae bacterium M23B6Z8]